ncbi:alpha/beta hydrolase [Aneurinibacillus danicus]|jgi:carboxylesterase|uniref:Esterase n=1 Tax=Aneurinibacillus danicus TaxID=267746 RepID=A0A511V8X0_9BACL|nr:alpha/beta fold hydrolase [Aneurinibacillus danicus]GEN33682.1 esterase [Aneurinibacillus danicus]
MAEKYPVLQDAVPFFFEGSDIGVLVQHGFTGTPQSMRFLGESLAEAGFTVYGPRLKGHGTHYEDMEMTTYEDWIASAEEGYRKLQNSCRQVFVVGLSMGGTIALHLAQQHPEIGGIMLINAAIRVENFEALRNETARYLDAIGSDIKAPGVAELAYDKTPVASVKEFLIFKDLVASRLSSVTCPALVLVSREDHVVPPADSNYILEHIGSQLKEKVVLENSYHVATLDNDKELIARQCAAFINEIYQSKVKP